MTDLPPLSQQIQDIQECAPMEQKKELKSWAVALICLAVVISLALFGMLFVYPKCQPLS